jgi:DNA-binding MarR family transcriptional regulator
MATGATQHEELRLDRQLCFALYAASRLVTRLYQPLLEPLALTYTQYVVLLILWEEAPCTVTRIGERAQLASSTLTPLLKRLEQLGYVTRQRETRDERSVRVGLTAAGRALRERCACIPEQMLERLRYPLGKARALKRDLDELVAHLAASAGPPARSPRD